MTDTPTKKEKPVDALPERPTWSQFKEVEMERDSAFASAERNAVKVEQLRGELKRAADKAAREKAKLANRLKADVLSWQIRAEDAEAELAELKEEIRKDAPLLSVIRTHANKDEPTKGCSCSVCKVLGSFALLREELFVAKRKYRETKDTLKTLQGPRSKKKSKGRR